MENASNFKCCVEGMNQFGDRQLNETLDPVVPIDNATNNEIPLYEESLVVIAALDYRTLGGVQVVKNQGSCGSCYVFAAVSLHL